MRSSFVIDLDFGTLISSNSLKKMAARAFLLIFFLWRVTGSNSVRDPVCPLNTFPDFVFPSTNDVCSTRGEEFLSAGGVIQGNEVTLQKALSSIHRYEYDYVALLFYSSWCPFSGPFRPSFSLLSSIFTSIPHFVIEESSVRPSILSKYGVHGFPSLILLNSTMRVRYQGSRTMDSLITFYKEFTVGIETSADRVSFEENSCSVYQRKHDSFNEETCPFPWARSPENLLHQQTYLTLATIFVILRMFYLIFPTFRKYTGSAWRRYCTVWSFWEFPAAYLNQVLQLLQSLKEQCKGRNLQEGAKTWASKSLSTVSFGDAGSSLDSPVSCGSR